MMMMGDNMMSTEMMEKVIGTATRLHMKYGRKEAIRQAKAATFLVSTDRGQFWNLVLESLKDALQ